MDNNTAREGSFYRGEAGGEGVMGMRRVERAFEVKSQSFDFMLVGWEANITRLPLGVVLKGGWEGEDYLIPPRVGR